MITTTDITEMLRPTEWLDTHGDYLFRFALVRVRNSAVAEDLVQETLLAAIGAAQRHEGQSSERTWLMGIMKHKVFDYFRRISRIPESQLAENEGRIESQCFDAPGRWREDQAPTSWSLDVVRLLESREFRETFDRCLLCLPGQMAIAFTLREIDGLSTEEICEILGVSPNNLWLILHRARLKLRQLLEVEWFRGGRTPATSLRNENSSRKGLESPLTSEFSCRAVSV